jgi:hypothetical protein
MAGATGSGSGSGGGDSNQEMVAKLLADAFQSPNFNGIPPEGVESLIGVLSNVVTQGIIAGQAKQQEEARKAAEDKAAEKKRKRDERARTGDLSPKSLEKKRRKEERDAIRKENRRAREREEERQKLPVIAVNGEGVPTPLAYQGARGTIRQIISSNFPRGAKWSAISKKEQKRVIGAVKAAFRNGGDLESAWIADKISNSMAQARYHDRMKIRAYLKELTMYRNLQRPLQFSEDIWKAFYQTEVQLKAAEMLKESTKELAKARKAGRPDRDLKALEKRLDEHQAVVDEVGNPPAEFVTAAERVRNTPNTTHRLGQGGSSGLKAAFVSIFMSFPCLS